MKINWQLPKKQWVSRADVTPSTVHTQRGTERQEPLGACQLGTEGPERSPLCREEPGRLQVLFPNETGSREALRGQRGGLWALGLGGGLAPQPPGAPKPDLAETTLPVPSIPSWCRAHISAMALLPHFSLLPISTASQKGCWARGGREGVFPGWVCLAAHCPAQGHVPP